MTTPERRFNKNTENLNQCLIFVHNFIIAKLVKILKASKKTFNVRTYICDNEWIILSKIMDLGFDIGITRTGHVYHDLAEYIAGSNGSKWLATQRHDQNKSISGDGSTDSNLSVIVSELDKFLPQTYEKLVILDSGVGDCGLWLKFFSENPKWVGRVKLVAVDIAMKTITANRLSKVRKLEELIGEDLVCIEGDSADADFLGDVIDECKPEFIFARTLVQHMTLPDIQTFLEVVSTSGAKFISTDFKKSNHSLMGIMPFGCIYRNIAELFVNAGIHEFKLTGRLEDTQGHMSVFEF